MRTSYILVFLHGQQLALIPGVVLLCVAASIVLLVIKVDERRNVLRAFLTLVSAVVGIVGLFFTLLGLEEWYYSGRLFW